QRLSMDTSFVDGLDSRRVAEASCRLCPLPGGLEMKPTLALLLSALLAVSIASSASAQLVAAKNGPIVYGHHHLNTTNVDAQKKFFVDTLGGTLIKIGTNNAEVVKFPNVLIFFRTNQAPTGGTRGTTVNHIGFCVPNLRQVVDTVKASGVATIRNDGVAAAPGGKDALD